MAENQNTHWLTWLGSNWHADVHFVVCEFFFFFGFYHNVGQQWAWYEWKKMNKKMKCVWEKVTFHHFAAWFYHFIIPQPISHFRYFLMWLCFFLSLGKTTFFFVLVYFCVLFDQYLTYELKLIFCITEEEAKRKMEHAKKYIDKRPWYREK